MTEFQPSDVFFDEFNCMLTYCSAPYDNCEACGYYDEGHAMMFLEKTGNVFCISCLWGVEREQYRFLFKFYMFICRMREKYVNSYNWHSWNRLQVLIFNIWKFKFLPEQKLRQWFRSYKARNGQLPNPDWMEN